ncbi:MAG: hypothetical protein M3Y21_00590, partial [Candidatus Eremiobacteraeota bacterium]|nr:hypothetical protein [Candidatus Eremiobacteraeota bacterium]
QLAPQLLTAQLVLAGIAAASIPAITAMILSDGTASAVAIWAGRIGGAATISSLITQLFSNMTPHDALQVLSRADTLYNDELVNNCATSSFT